MRKIPFFVTLAHALCIAVLVLQVTLVTPQKNEPKKLVVQTVMLQAERPKIVAQVEAKSEAKSEERFEEKEAPEQVVEEVPEESIAEVVEEPVVQEPENEPEKEQVEEPVKEPKKEPVKVEEPLKEPIKVKEPIKEPTKEVAKEPVKTAKKEPIKKPAPQPKKAPVKAALAPTPKKKEQKPAKVVAKKSTPQKPKKDAKIVTKKSTPPPSPKKEQKQVVKEDPSLKYIQEALSKIEDSASLHSKKSNSPSSKATHTPTPSRLSNLQSESIVTITEESASYKGGEKSYYDELVMRLKLALVLPEYGDVKVKLTLSSLGKVVKVQVLSSKSKKNRDYITNALTKISFPRFGSNFKNEKEHTFSLSLCNQL